MMNKEEKIDAIKNGKIVRISDIIIFAVLAVVISVIIIFVSMRESGDTVEIYCSGELVGSYSLETDASFEYGGLCIVISNGECYVACSDCDDHICEYFGSISKVNETIICVPNSIVIKVVGDSGLSAVV